MAGGRIDIEVAPDLRGFDSKLGAGLRSATGVASTLGKGLGLAVAAGTALAAVGLKSVLDIGIEYTNQLNTLQSVTQATGVQMAAVGNLAKELGADMSLPATSAADAAAAMTELAKGGLSVEQAMTAAKGTLQLAAAAQVDAAQAAEIQSDALNQFGLAADQASHVADVLANTANAASGEITDMANALKFVGPVARSMGVDIDNVATGIGLLAVNGIRGEQAGTSLRGMLASLAAPSKPAAAALETLGIVAFDATGKFVGLRSITEQLAAAKGKLTDQTFTQAAATAFGNEGLTIANALANSGAKAFDDMAVAVGRSGGAADVAAAKTRGLGGAWEGFKSQVETAQIGIFEAISPTLEQVVRAGADMVERLGDATVKGINTAVAVGEVYGPRLADAIKSRGQVVGQAVSDILAPIGRSAVNPLNEALNRSIGLWDDFTGVLKNASDGAKPVSQGISELVKASADGDGPVSALGSGIGLLGDVAKAASGLLVPLGQVVGGIASAFAALPGPVQSAVLGLVAYRVATSALKDTSFLSGVRQFSGEMQVQRSLAAANGEQIGRLGSAMAAYRTSTVGAVAAARGFTDQTAAIRAGAAAVERPIGVMSAAIGTLVERSPGLSQMRASFDNAAGGATRFGTAAGIAAASGTGLKLAAGGLMAAMGGPFGIAIAGAAVGLALLGANQQEAAEKARRHASAVDGLAAALRESNGQINEQVRLSVAQRFLGEEFTVAAKAAKTLSVSMEDITSAALGQGDSLDGLRTRLQGVISAHTTQADVEANAAAGIQDTSSYMDEQGVAAQNLLNAINALAGDTDAANRKNKDLAQAIKDGKASMLDATDSGRTLAGAMKILSSTTASADDRARALKDALDALSGGSVNLEAAQVRMQDHLARLRDLFGENVDKTKGWGETLLNTDGSINSTMENGRRLSDSLRDLSGSTAEVVQKTYDMAISQGEGVPAATAKAQAAMQTAREEFIKTAGQMGITADQAAVLADRAGLIPQDVSMLVKAVDADKTMQELILIKALVDRVPPDKPITVRSLSDEAKAKLIDLGYTVETTPNNVTITANSDRARQELTNFLNAPATKVVTVVYNVETGAGAPKPGGPAVMSHDGNIVKAFASGGFHKLTPMRTGIAQVVPPNTWRVVGDRIRDDEAYIPINRSTRSHAILTQTAERMGYALMRRYAAGGINGSAMSSPAPVAAVGGGTFVGNLVLEDGTFMGRVRGVVQHELNEAGSAINRRKRV